MEMSHNCPILVPLSSYRSRHFFSLYFMIINIIIVVVVVLVVMLKVVVSSCSSIDGLIKFSGSQIHALLNFYVGVNACVCVRHQDIKNMFLIKLITSISEERRFTKHHFSIIPKE